MKQDAYKVGDKVTWKDTITNIWTKRKRTITHVGRVYRVDSNDRFAVLPDSWAKEGKTSGVMRCANELTLTGE